MLIKNPVSEMLSLLLHMSARHVVSKLALSRVPVIKIRQITRGMLCGPAHALTTPYRGFLFIYIKS
jgi:hypothetical protein